MKIRILGSYPQIKDGQSLYTENFVKALLAYRYDEIESIYVLPYYDDNQNSEPDLSE